MAPSAEGGNWSEFARSRGDCNRWHGIGGKRETGDLDLGRRRHAHLAPGYLPAARCAESAHPRHRYEKPACVPGRSSRSWRVARNPMRAKERELMRLLRTSAVVIAVVAAAGLAPLAAAKTKPKTIQRETQAAYIQRMQQQSPDLSHTTPGSLWTDNGRFANLSADYKATHVGDLITIVVAHGTTATNTASVATARTLSASSGITALAGHIKTSGVQSIFSPNSTATLSGKSQGSSTSVLNDTLAGRV